MCENERLRYTSNQKGDKMYRVGICDDDLTFGFQIESYLKEYAKKEGIEIETEVFTSGEEYLQFLDEKPKLDLLFLDIELGQRVNGILVGRMIRTDISNEVTQIVYVSSKENYAMQLFRNRPMDFLIKPITMNDIERIMKEYIKLFSDKKNFFECYVKRVKRRISDNEIIYFQCAGKKICINTVQHGKIEFYGKMEDVKKQVDQNRFWEIHKSYIINVDFVSEFCVEEIQMVNGEWLPVSQAFRKRVQQKLLEKNIERR